MDVVLRPPLDSHGSQSSGGGSSGGISSSDRTQHVALCGKQHRRIPVQQQQQQHNDFVRPSISAVLVGASVLQVSVEVRYTAAVLLHRYYSNIIRVHPDTPATTPCFNQHNDIETQKYVLAACLLLACKREEEPRRLRDFVNVVLMMDWTLHDNKTDDKQKPDKAQPFIDQSSDITTRISWCTTPPDLVDNDDVYWTSKQRLVQTERHVLQALSFDVAVSRPHRAVALLLFNPPSSNSGGGDGDGSGTASTIRSNHDNGFCSDSDYSNHAVLRALAVAIDGETTLNNASMALQSKLPSLQEVSHSTLRVLNGTVFSSAALQHAVLPLAVASIVVAAAAEAVAVAINGNTMAESLPQATETPLDTSSATAVSSDSSSRNDSLRVNIATALISLQWWAQDAPSVSLFEVRAAVDSLHQLYYNRTL